MRRYHTRTVASNVPRYIIIYWDFFLILLLFFVDSGKHSPDCDGVNRGSKHAVHNMDILLLIDINFINTNRLGNTFQRLR